MDQVLKKPVQPKRRVGEVKIIQRIKKNVWAKIKETN